MNENTGIPAPSIPSIHVVLLALSCSLFAPVTAAAATCSNNNVVVDRYRSEVNDRADFNLTVTNPSPGCERQTYSLKGVMPGIWSCTTDTSHCNTVPRPEAHQMNLEHFMGRDNPPCYPKPSDVCQGQSYQIECVYEVSCGGYGSECGSVKFNAIGTRTDCAAPLHCTRWDVGDWGPFPCGSDTEQTRAVTAAPPGCTGTPTDSPPRDTRSCAGCAVRPTTGTDASDIACYHDARTGE